MAHAVLMLRRREKRERTPAGRGTKTVTPLRHGRVHGFAFPGRIVFLIRQKVSARGPEVFLRLERSGIIAPRIARHRVISDRSAVAVGHRSDSAPSGGGIRFDLERFATIPERVHVDAQVDFVKMTRPEGDGKLNQKFLTEEGRARAYGFAPSVDGVRPLQACPGTEKLVHRELCYGCALIGNDRSICWLKHRPELAARRYSHREGSGGPVSSGEFTATRSIHSDWHSP